MVLVCICYARQLSHFGRHEGHLHFLPASPPTLLRLSRRTAQKKPAKTAQKMEAD